MSSIFPPTRPQKIPKRPPHSSAMIDPKKVMVKAVLPPKIVLVKTSLPNYQFQTKILMMVHLTLMKD